MVLNLVRDVLICSSYLLIWLVLDWQFSSHQPSNPQAPVSFLQKKSINVKKSIARCKKHEKTHLLITLIESVFMARIMHPFILRGFGSYCDIVHWLILNGHTGPTISSYGVSTEPGALKYVVIKKSDGLLMLLSTMEF